MPFATCIPTLFCQIDKKIFGFGVLNMFFGCDLKFRFFVLITEIILPEFPFSIHLSIASNSKMLLRFCFKNVNGKTFEREITVKESTH